MASKTSAMNCPVMDYHVYHWTGQTFLEDVAKGTGLWMAAGYVCYRWAWPAILLGTAVPIYMHRAKGRRRKDRASRLNMEFRSTLLALYSSITAGQTLEAAFSSAAQDIKREGNCPMMSGEMGYIMYQLKCNIPLEKALAEFSVRCDDEDIMSFAQIVSIAKRNGGSMKNISGRAIHSISSKIETGAEIETMLAGRRAELRIMMAVPAGIILYLNVCAGEFMEVLYSTAAGQLIMTFCLGLYMFAGWLGQRMLNIKV